MQQETLNELQSRVRSEFLSTNAGNPVAANCLVRRLAPESCPPFIEVDLELVESGTKYLTARVFQGYPKEKPQLFLNPLYSQPALTGSGVSQHPRAIDYASIAPWQPGRSSLADLSRRVHTFLISPGNLPREIPELSAFREKTARLDKLVADIKNVSPEALLEELGPAELSRLDNPTEAERVLRTHPPFREAFGLLQDLNEETLKNLVQAEQLRAQIDQTKQNDPRVKNFLQAKSNYVAALKQYEELRSRITLTSLAEALDKELIQCRAEKARKTEEFMNSPNDGDPTRLIAIYTKVEELELKKQEVDRQIRQPESNLEGTTYR